jgi:hypothetical protein
MAEKVIDFLKWILKSVQNKNDDESEEILISHFKTIAPMCLDKECWNTAKQIVYIVGHYIQKKVKKLPPEDEITTFLMRKYQDEPSKWNGIDRRKTFETTRFFDDFIHHDLGFFQMVGVKAAQAKNKSLAETAIFQLKHLLYEIETPVTEKEKYGDIISYTLLYIKYIYDALNNNAVKLSLHLFDYFIGELIRRGWEEEAWTGLEYFCAICIDGAKKETLIKFELNSLGTLARGYASNKKDNFLDKTLDTLGTMAFIYKKKKQFNLFNECKEQIKSASTFSKRQINKVDFWLAIIEYPLEIIGVKDFANTCSQYKTKDKAKKSPTAVCLDCLNYEVCNQAMWV